MERLEAMEAFLKKFGTTGVPVANNYKGPRNNRELKSNGYAQFVDTDARDQFLKKAEGTPLLCKGVSLAVRRGKPQFFRHRDWALYKAKDVLTAAYKDKKVESKREKEGATMTVGGELAF